MGSLVWIATIARPGQDYFIALHPAVVSDLGLSLTPLQCEAILLSIVVFLAVNLAWLLMFEDVPESA